MDLQMLEKLKSEIKLSQSITSKIQALGMEQRKLREIMKGKSLSVEKYNKHVSKYNKIVKEKRVLIKKAYALTKQSKETLLKLKTDISM